MFLILHFYSCIKILKCELQLNSHSALSIISLVLILSKPSYWRNITLDTGCHKGIKPPNSNNVYFTGERAAVQKKNYATGVVNFCGIGWGEKGF